MKSKTDSTKKMYRHLLPKLVKCMLVFLPFAMTTTSYAQKDSCSAKAYFTLATTDHKNVTITNLSSGSNLKYLWNFMDGISSTDPNPVTHVYSDLAMHYVHLQLTDTIQNCSSYFMDTLFSPCSADFYFMNNQHDFTFTSVSSSSSTNIFSWDFGDGSTSSLANPSHHYVNAGNYNTCLTVTSTLNPNCSDTRCLPVYINDSCFAYAYFTVKTTDYKNLAITDHSLGSNLAHLWNFGDGTSSTDPNPGTHMYTDNSAHVISLKVTDTLKNCSSENVQTIRRPCSAYFSFTSNHLDYNFTFNTSMDPSTTTFAWDFGDGSNSTLANPSHHYVNTGSYNACLTVTSSLDATCSDIHCAYIYANDSISTDDSLNNCSAKYNFYFENGNKVHFFATQSNNSYLWDFGDGTTSTLQNPSYVFSASSFYNVCLTVSRNSCSVKNCNTIFVNVPSYCKALFAIAPDSSTTDPYDFFIYNLASGNNLTYLWDFGDSTTSTLLAPTHDYAGTGPYVICLTVKNDSCNDTYCDTLDLSDTVHRILPGKFHINVINKTTRIQKNDLNKATLLNYPNPFNSTTTISYGISTSSSVELEVYNLLGVRVATIDGGTKAPGNYTLEWNAQQLQEGIYLLQLKTNGQSITKKIIINK
jgi:PKD repeat protein